MFTPATALTYTWASSCSKMILGIPPVNEHRRMQNILFLTHCRESCRVKSRSLTSIYITIFHGWVGAAFQAMVDGKTKTEPGTKHVTWPPAPPIQLNPDSQPCVRKTFSTSFVGSISAALSCLVYPPREETAGRVSGKPCLWRQFLIKILAVPLVVANVICFQSLAGSHDAYGS